MPDWSDDLGARMAAVQLTPAREAEIVEELSQHLDDRYEGLRSSGASAADAHRLAIEELDEAGGLERRMQGLSQAHMPPVVIHGQPGAHPLRGIWSDVRYAVRTVTRERGFAATVVLTLALGIAVNATIFTVVNASLLRPLPMTGGERMVRLSVVNVEAQDQDAGISYLDFQDWRTAQRAFDDIQATAERSVAVTDDERAATRVNAAYVSWNTFALIGQPPALGRDFVEADDRDGAAPVVIVGGSLWRTRYGSDPSLVGKTIRVSGVPSTVVGIMPGRFGFPDNADLWLPLVALPDEERASRGTRSLEGTGRLRSNVTIEQVGVERTHLVANERGRGRCSGYRSGDNLQKPWRLGCVGRIDDRIEIAQRNTALANVADDSDDGHPARLGRQTRPCVLVDQSDASADHRLVLEMQPHEPLVHHDCVIGRPQIIGAERAAVDEASADDIEVARAHPVWDGDGG